MKRSALTAHAYNIFPTAHDPRITEADWEAFDKMQKQDLGRRRRKDARVRRCAAARDAQKQLAQDSIRALLEWSSEQQVLKQTLGVLADLAWPTEPQAAAASLRQTLDALTSFERPAWIVPAFAQIAALVEWPPPLPVVLPERRGHSLHGCRDCAW